jgi:hypothetical protein
MMFVILWVVALSLIVTPPIVAMRSMERLTARDWIGLGRGRRLSMLTVMLVPWGPIATGNAVVYFAALHRYRRHERKKISCTRPCLIVARFAAIL